MIIRSKEYTEGMKDLWKCLRAIATGEIEISYMAGTKDVKRLVKEYDFEEFVKAATDRGDYTNLKCHKCGCTIAGSDRGYKYCPHCATELEKEITDCDSCINGHDIECRLRGCKGQWKYIKAPEEIFIQFDDFKNFVIEQMNPNELEDHRRMFKASGTPTKGE